MNKRKEVSPYIVYWRQRVITVDDENIRLKAIVGDLHLQISKLQSQVKELELKIPKEKF